MQNQYNKKKIVGKFVYIISMTALQNVLIPSSIKFCTANDKI